MKLTSSEAVIFVTRVLTTINSFVFKELLQNRYLGGTKYILSIGSISKMHVAAYVTSDVLYISKLDTSFGICQNIFISLKNTKIFQN